MASSKGRLFLLKKGDGGSPESFTTVGAAEVTITITNEQVDNTNQADAPDRSLMAAAGQNAVTVAANGVHKGEAAGIVAMRADALSGAIGNYQVTNTESGEDFTITAAFQIASYELTGVQNDVLRFTCTLESSGSKTVS